MSNLNRNIFLFMYIHGYLNCGNYLYDVYEINVFQGTADDTYREVNRNWMEAKKFCKEMAEGTLAGFNDEETRNFLANYQTYDTSR